MKLSKYKTALQQRAIERNFHRKVIWRSDLKKQSYAYKKIRSTQNKFTIYSPTYVKNV